MFRKSRTSVGAFIVAIAGLAILSACAPQQPQPKSQSQSEQPTEQPTEQLTAEASGDKKEATDTAPSDEKLRPDTHDPVNVPAAVSSALEIIQKQIMDYVSAEGTKYTFGAFVDPDAGRIVLETDAPSDIVAKLTQLPDSATDEQRHAAKDARIENVTTSSVWNRRDDIQAFWGSAGIVSGSTLCSSGYAVRNAAGQRFMTTAGHCFANGATVQVESGLRTYGTVSNRHLPSVTGGTADMELVGGQSYNPFIYSGGVTSTSDRRVVGAGDACIFCNNYCHSGRTTGENCGHTAIWLLGLTCTENGCMFPTTVFTGGTLPNHGDSGGAFYVRDNSGNVWIRGNVIAIGGPFAYAEPWGVISSTLHVSIVT